MVILSFGGLRPIVSSYGLEIMGAGRNDRVNMIFETLGWEFRLGWQFSPHKIFGMGWIIFLSTLIISGCASTGTYREEHHISKLKIVFLDQQSLHKEWKSRTGQQGIEFASFREESTPRLKTLHGFFDFSSNTLYCPKWNFEVCGHELHHAVLGHFHQPQ